MSESERKARATFDRTNAKFQISLRTRNSDTDQFRHINNAVIASFLEEARMAIFQDADLGASMRGKNVVIAHLAIDFLKEIYYPTDIDVWTATDEVRNTSFALTQGLFVGDTLCAHAKAVCVLMDSELGRPISLPDALRRQLSPTSEVERNSLATNR